nr:hypothetical protein BSM_10670 [uncultured archaeon]
MVKSPFSERKLMHLSLYRKGGGKKEVFDKT